MPSTQDDLSRLLDPTYLDDVDGLSLDDIRRMRAECQEAEASLSYLRRLIQGRMDIVHAYLERPGRARRPPTCRAWSTTWPASWPVPAGPSGPGATRSSTRRTPTTWPS